MFLTEVGEFRQSEVGVHGRAEHSRAVHEVLGTVSVSESVNVGVSVRVSVCEREREVEGEGEVGGPCHSAT